MGSAYLKLTGANDLPLSQFPWRDSPSLETQIRFPKDKFPGREIGPGDTLVLYAVGGWKSVFAIVEVVGHPERDVPGGDSEVIKRWPHAVRVARTPYYVEDLNHAPALWDVSHHLPEKIGKGVSHFSISQADAEKARALLQKARILEGRP